MQKFFVIISLMTVCYTANAEVPDSIGAVSSVQMDSNQVTLRFGGGDCTAAIQATAEVTQIAGPQGNKFEGILIKIVPTLSDCSDSRVFKNYTVQASLKDLAQAATQKLTEAQRTLPVQYQAPTVYGRSMVEPDGFQNMFKNL